MDSSVPNSWDFRRRVPEGSSFRDRLLSGVFVDLDDPEACWAWRGGKVNGYGRIRRGKKMIPVHTAMFEEFRGSLPEGTEPDHMCHDPDECGLGNKCPHRSCGNPWHMEPATPAENKMRSSSPAAVNARRQICPEHGCQLLRNSRQRYCPECEKVRRSAWRAEHSGYNSEYRDRNIERLREYDRNRDPEVKKARNKAYYQANRGRLLAAQRERDRLRRNPGGG